MSVLLGTRKKAATAKGDRRTKGWGYRAQVREGVGRAEYEVMNLTGGEWRPTASGGRGALTMRGRSARMERKESRSVQATAAAEREGVLSGGAFLPE
jgi:hypothetical protein